MGAGLDPAYFWVITLREAFVIMEGAADRARRDRDARRQMVYATGMLTRAAMLTNKRMPRFDEIFPPDRAKRQAQSTDEMVAVMRAWTSVIAKAQKGS